MHRSRFALAGAVVALCVTCALARADVAPVTVQTAAGTVAGSVDYVKSFKGIPFAAPPVGPLRWKPPQPVKPWSGVLDATRFGPECEQAGPPGAVMSEDCLSLNVWTPADTGERLPVVVYFFGGGFAVGNASLPTFDGTALARRGVVVVVPNYRLGVFGFLALPALVAESPEHTAGNYGLLDQVAALQWVQANIAAFGGDPRKVTIMGESAGAASVSALLTMPRAKGLYVRAIMESAPVLRPQLNAAQAQSAGTQYAAGQTLAQLRAAPAADLLRRIPPLDPDTRSDVAITFGPIADGVVLPDERETYAQGRETVVPLIIGNNADEGSFFARGVPVKTLAQYAAALQKRFGAQAARARQLYPARTDDEANAAEATIIGDMDINTGVRKVAKLFAAREPEVYRYVFAHRRGGKLPGHSDELPYVFGTPAVNGVGVAVPPFDDADWRVSDEMQARWAQFIKTGDPNPPGRAAWPRYTVRGDRFIVFGDTVSTGTGFRTTWLDFLDLTTGR